MVSPETTATALRQKLDHLNTCQNLVNQHGLALQQVILLKTINETDIKSSRYAININRYLSKFGNNISCDRISLLMIACNLILPPNQKSEIK